jgi:sugar lactone lactonase YvrE
MWQRTFRIAFLVLILAALGLPGMQGRAQSPDREITQPGSLIISDTQGVLWAFDLERSELRLLHNLGFGGNFDIQYRRPFELIIANLGGSLHEFNILTRDITTLVQGPTVGAPIGVTVIPGEGYYFTDHFSARRVLRYDPRTDALDVIATVPTGGGFGGGSLDGIAHDARGRLIVTAQSGHIFRISTSPLNIEVITHISGHSLNGIVLTRRGTIIVTSHAPAAVFEVDPRTGTYTALWQGLPLRNPEDVAIDHRGLIYVLDSDFLHSFPDFLPGIYSLNPDTSQLTALYTGAPLGDVVDILLTPFDGFR